jgi:hypothetical protein
VWFFSIQLFYSLTGNLNFWRHLLIWLFIILKMFFSCTQFFFKKYSRAFLITKIGRKNPTLQKLIHFLSCKTYFNYLGWCFDQKRILKMMYLISKIQDHKHIIFNSPFYQPSYFVPRLQKHFPNGNIQLKT